MRYGIEGKVIEVLDDEQFTGITEEEVTQIYRGVAKVITVGVKDAGTLDPIDLTGATVHAALGGITLDSYYAPLGNPILGKAQLTIPAFATTGMAVGRSVLELEVLRTGQDAIVLDHNVVVSDLPL